MYQNIHQQNNPYFQNYNMPQYQGVNQMEGYQHAAAPQVFLKGRPVVSVEEVRSAQVDFDGSLFIFPDMNNQCIYTKQASPNGVVINKYILEEQNAKPASSEFVSKEEFTTAINQLKAAIEHNLTTQSQPSTAAPKEFNFV